MAVSITALAAAKAATFFKFIMALEGLSFPEAVRKVADRCGIELPEERGSAGGPVRKDLFALLDSVARLLSSSVA